MKINHLLITILILASCSEGSMRLDNVWKEITIKDEPVVTHVELFSEQFKWTVRYSGKDNTLGKFDYKLTSEINPLAILTTDAIEVSILEMQFGEDGITAMTEKLEESSELLSSSKREELKVEILRKEKLIRLLKQMQLHHDDRVDIPALDDIILTDTLVLLVDEAIELQFRSKDVIHSAYFPELRAQMNAVPGMTTRFKFTPEFTTEEMRLKRKDTNFDYTLMCNKICGAGHYSMKMVARVLEKDEYDSWMQQKSKLTFSKTVEALKIKKEQLLIDNTGNK